MEINSQDRGRATKSLKRRGGMRDENIEIKEIANIKEPETSAAEETAVMKKEDQSMVEYNKDDELMKNASDDADWEKVTSRKGDAPKGEPVKGADNSPKKYDDTSLDDDDGGSGKGNIVVIIILIALIVVCLAVFFAKMTGMFGKGSASGDASQVTEEQKNAEEADYANRLGDLEVVMQFTDNTAPQDTAGVSDYFYGQTYDLNLSFSFMESADASANISLQYSNIVEVLSKSEYKTRKKALASSSEYYEFDNKNCTITEVKDWIETDDHSVYDYDHDAVVTDWVAVMDSCMNQIEKEGDGVELLPLLPESMTVNVNGETYLVVFNIANGYYIEDDALDSSSGSSKNYIIVADAYLKAL